MIRNRLLDPLHPFGQVEPMVLQPNEPSDFQGSPCGRPYSD